MPSNVVVLRDGETEAPQLHLDDRVTLRAIVTFEYEVTRVSYLFATKPGFVPDDAEMAAVDQSEYDSGDITLEELIAWSDGNAVVKFEPVS